MKEAVAVLGDVWVGWPGGQEGDETSDAGRILQVAPNMMYSGIRCGL